MIVVPKRDRHDGIVAHPTTRRGAGVQIVCEVVTPRAFAGQEVVLHVPDADVVDLMQSLRHRAIHQRMKPLPPTDLP